MTLNTSGHLNSTAKGSNRTTPDYDVIVAGAGLAGLQCARLLGERGLRVLLTDRKKSLQSSVHTTGIFVRRTLEDFPIPEDCLGPAVRHVSLYSPARRRMDLSSVHDEFRVGRMGPLYERYLERCLRAGVTWMPATSYSGHVMISKESPDLDQENEEFLSVRLDHSGVSRWLTARYIVGAEGANSRVARDLQLDGNREFLVGVEDVYRSIPLDGPPRLHCFLDSRIAPGYLAWVAHDGEETHIGVGGYASLFDPLRAQSEFRSSLDGIVDLSQAEHLERRSGRIPVGGVLRNIANSRGLLVGDAAGAVSPLTAGGLDPCMRLSTLAASVIAAYLETEDPTVLEEYSGELFRARFASRLRMRRVISKARSRVLLELVCAGMRLPVCNRFAWHVFFGRGSFPDVDVSWSPVTAARGCR